MVKSIKGVIVGDEGVGKSSMLMAYIKDSFPEKFDPTNFGDYTINIKVKTLDISFDLLNIDGQEDYDRLRFLGYPRTNVFLLCFSLVSPASLNNISEKWAPEVKHYCPNASIILVGTKLDLRNSKKISPSILEENQRPISFDEGRQLAEKIGAANYLECSALSPKGLKMVFDEAINIAIDRDLKLLKKKKKKKQKKCIIL